jgi:DNA-binding MarR family transcriptional regulator
MGTVDEDVAKCLPLLFYVFVTCQRVKGLLSHALADAPLAYDEYAVYGLVGVAGPRSSAEFARILSMPQTTMSDYVRAMVERGHARRVPNPRDGRSFHLELTPAGRAAWDESTKSFSEAAERFEGALGLPPERVREALREIDAAGDRALAGLLEDAIARAG